jgi:hypothetical protein
VIQKVKDGAPVDVATTFASQTKGNDKILYLMERGRMAQVQGDPTASLANYAEAIAAIKDNDRKAVISASGSGAQAAAIVLNDNAIPYEGSGYERVLLHNCQALNYLAMNDIDGAGVEVRIANAEQEAALKKHQRDLHKALANAEEHNAAGSLDDPAISAKFDAMDAAAARVKTSFQNAYTFYVSAVIWELSGEENDAYIDYKKALEIFPGNKYVQRDVVRLAKQLGMTDDLDRFKAKLSTATVEDAAQVASKAVAQPKSGLPPDDFSFWLSALRGPYEARDRAALDKAIAAFRNTYKDRPDAQVLEEQVVAYLKGREPKTSSANKTGLPENEFRFWVAVLRQPYEAKDQAGLAATLAQFRARYQGRPDLDQVERQLVTTLREQVVLSSRDGTEMRTDHISDVEFACWCDRFRIPYEKKDKAGLAAAVAEFRQTFRLCPDVDLVERRLVERLTRPKPRRLADPATAKLAVGELIVLFEDDFVPQKQEVKIPVALPSLNTIVAVAFPIYIGDSPAPAQLSVADGPHVLGSTETICDVRALAVKSLKERVPGIVTRQVIRSTAKAVASSAVVSSARNRNQGQSSNPYAELLAGLGMAIYNIATENADLRSWTTLPRDAQIMRVAVPAGNRELKLAYGSSGCEATIPVVVKPGGKTVLRVVRTGSRLYSNSMTF